MDLYSLLVLPGLIFLARVVDVSLGTLRIIFISRGRRNLAPILGFIEVFIWIVVVSQITRGANNLAAYLGYAAGFAAGNFAGIWIEDRLAIGTMVVRAILPSYSEEPDYAAAAADLLHRAGYGVTRVAGEGTNGPVSLVYTVVRRKDLAEAITLIHQCYAHAFITVEEVRTAHDGIFPSAETTRLAVFGQRKGR